MSDPTLPRRGRAIPDPVWAPLAAGGLMLLIGAVALAAGQPYLFPSLGPTAFLQAEYPDHRTSRAYHVVVGHLVGLAAGVLAVWVTGAGATPAALAGGQLTPARVAAAALAVPATMALQMLLRASHPPAVATTLLVALGAFRASGHDAVAIAVGVALIGLLGDVLRQVRLGARAR